MTAVWWNIWTPAS